MCMYIMADVLRLSCMEGCPISLQLAISCIGFSSQYLLHFDVESHLPSWEEKSVTIPCLSFCRELVRHSSGSSDPVANDLLRTEVVRIDTETRLITRDKIFHITCRYSDDRFPLSILLCVFSC